MAKKPTLEILTSYLKTIENSAGSNLFRNLYYRIDDKVIDVLDDGDLSCAVYVTAILHMFSLVKEIHTTVVCTIEDMVESGWYKIKEPKQGAVIHWDYKKLEDGTRSKNRHVGFYIDEETALSNDPVTKTIIRHHPTYGVFRNGEARRDILAYYWNDKLNA